MVKKVMIACLILAVISAVVYVLMGVGLLKAGDLTGESMPAFYYIIPGGYLIGGLLVLLNKRWLLLTGAIINAFTIVMFYTMYATQPDVMLSAPGLMTKIAQVLLEIGLIYLIVMYTRRSMLARASE
jgi:hypothetical protein